MTMKLGRVAAVHPEDHSIDVVMIDDGARISGVQLLTSSGSGNTGVHDLPTPGAPPSGDKWSLTERTDRDMIAVIGYIGIMPVAVGFLFPQVSQMLFKDQNRRLMRHASDVYTTIDGDGNTELYHPSGTYLRIGASGAHEDLSGKDVDGKLAITKNTSAAVHVHLEVANAGAHKASIDIDPSGNVTVTHEGNLDLHTKGTATVAVDGTTTVTSTGAATLEVPAGLTINGPVAITGASLTHNGTNVGSSHVHGGITPGGADTAGPH